MGFQTVPAFVGPDLVACGSTNGNLLFFNSADGSLRTQIRLEGGGDVLAVSAYAADRVLILTRDGPAWVNTPFS